MRGSAGFPALRSARKMRLAAARHALVGLLELPDGATRGFVTLGPDGGHLALGMDGEGSLLRFMAYGTISRVIQDTAQGQSFFHYEGTYNID